MTMTAAEFCGVVYGDCLNPAGYGNGRGHASNSDGPRVRAHCSECGQACCANCRTGKRGSWRCLSCIDREAYFAEKRRLDVHTAIRAPLLAAW